MSKTDARVRFTVKVIEESFLELLWNKPLSKITVKELCEKAEINRATFYKHYLDIYDLFDRLESRMLKNLSEAFVQNDGDFSKNLTEMIKYTKANGAGLMAIGSSNGDPEFMSKSFEVCCKSVFMDWMVELGSNKGELVFDFVSFGGGAVLRRWIQRGMKESPEEIAELLIGLSKGAIAAAKA